MNHFEPEDWVDFVRNVGEAGHREEMQRHRDRNCAVCIADHAMWSSVAGSFVNAVQTGPDESLVRAVTAVFGFYGPRRQAGVGGMAKILVDSALALSQGVRSTDSSSRQLLFERDGIHVDLRIERHPEAHSLLILGQVLRHSTEGPFVAAAPVLLVGRNAPWRYLVTNEIGEFQFELEDLNDMHLAFGLAGQTLLVPLSEPSSQNFLVPPVG